MNMATAGTDGWQRLDLVNDKMETAAVILDHVGHFIVWNAKELCDSIQSHRVSPSGWRCWQAKPYQIRLAPDVLFYATVFKELLSIDWPIFNFFTKEPNIFMFSTS
jgi:hypothetical protein